MLVIESLTSLGSQLETEDAKREILESEAKSRFGLLGIAILVQSWISGLFLGKITTGSYSGGFMYSIFLVSTTIGAIVIIQMKIFSVSAIFG